MQTVATHIEIRQNRSGQDRAYIEGTRVRVQDVAVMAEYHGRTPDQIVDALPHLTLGQVHAALSYYFDHRADIQRELREDEDFVAQVRAVSGTSILEQKLKAKSGSADDAIPSR
jgi:uncharacterized protein (DUF433 family)